MKIVSFKIAKALKEAGFPQGYMGGDWCYENGQYPDESECSSPPLQGYILLPTYLEVWLWLWREKGIQILNDDIGSANILPFCITISEYEDPEKAIIAAIECLVDNDLIK